MAPTGSRREPRSRDVAVVLSPEGNGTFNGARKLIHGVYGGAAATLARKGC